MDIKLLKTREKRWVQAGQIELANRRLQPLGHLSGVLPSTVYQQTRRKSADHSLKGLSRSVVLDSSPSGSRHHRLRPSVHTRYNVVPRYIEAKRLSQAE